MHINNTVLLAALSAGTALAFPSLHHRHQQFHEHKRAVGDIVHAVIDGVEVSWTNEYAGGAAEGTASAVSDGGVTPAATSTSASVAATSASSADSTTSTASSSSDSSSSNSDNVSTYTSFCSSSSKKRATAEEIAYKGNTGTSSDWGCNQLLIDSSVASQYKYTMKFTGQNTEDWQCVCWNKVGPDSLLDGWFGHSAVDFTLASGGEQYVAFDADSQGGCACGAGSVPKDTNGEWASTWVEFDFGNTSNNGWSGTDASSLVASASGMSVQGMQVSIGSCTSTILSDGSGTNSYIAGTESEDGIGCNVQTSNVAVEVVVDYSA